MSGGTSESASHAVPEPEELMSGREIADLLGVQPSTVRNYHARGQMPAPYVKLACGPIWLRSDIEHWARFERRTSTGTLTPD